MASAIIGGKRRVLRAELQKKGKNQEQATGQAEKPVPVKKKAKKKSAY